MFNIGLAFAQIFSSAFDAQAMGDAQRLNSQIVDQNMQLNNMKALDIKKAGDQQASGLRTKAKQIQSDQTLEAAAQGLDVTKGNVATLIEETEYLSLQDANIIRNNAAREAFGLKVENSNMAFQNKINQITTRNKQMQTLAAGGMQAATGLMKANTPTTTTTPKTGLSAGGSYRNTSVIG